MGRITCDDNHGNGCCISEAKGANGVAEMYELIIRIYSIHDVIFLLVLYSAVSLT